MYQQGDVLVREEEFRDPVTDALVDPTTVKFKYETPAAVETVLTYPHANLTKLSVGVYQARVNLDAGGTWKFEWVTTGTYQGAENFERYVRPSDFT